MQDTSTTPQTPKRGRGRPAGSVNFVSVTMKDLAAAVNSEGRVVVHKKFADALGLQGKVGSAADLVAKSVASAQDSDSFAKTVTDDASPSSDAPSAA